MDIDTIELLQSISTNLMQLANMKDAGSNEYIYLMSICASIQHYINKKAEDYYNGK